MQLKKSHNFQKGVGLLEVLIAVLIVSVSLLGLSALINTSLYTNQSAYAQTTAASLIYDAADRIRSNPNENYTVNLAYTPPNERDTSCEDASCNTLQMRNYDINNWLLLLSTNLTNGDASIRVAGDTAQITVVWLSSLDGSSDDTNESLQLEVNL